MAKTALGKTKTTSKAKSALNRPFKKDTETNGKMDGRE